MIISELAYGGHSICGSTMTRNRFEQLLAHIHLANNETADDSNRLYKIDTFIQYFNRRCQEIYRPGKKICIDESLIPFRGRIIFRQYIPNKRHRYGIKIFKLCCAGGYTYNMSIYSGKRPQQEPGTVAERIVFELSENLLNSGRTLFTDNWYSSVQLAQKLLIANTNFVGTLRKNRKGIPKQLVATKLKRGEMAVTQNKSGIFILKWKDKRDVLMISTVHDDSVNEFGKPLVVCDYNNSKTFIDISDQMSAYYPFIRKTTKWYIRIFFHIVCQTAIVNALNI